MLKVCCQFVFVPIVIAIFVYLLVTDLVAGLFAVVIGSAIGIFSWFYRPAFARRWIDFAVPQGEGWWFHPSYAEQVEIWIAERERRLVQLKRDDDPVGRNPA